MSFIPGEVQGYIRHILHVTGMLLASRAGYSHEFVEMFVAMGVNGISLAWFIQVERAKRKKIKQENAEAEIRLEKEEEEFARISAEVRN